MFVGFFVLNMFVGVVVENFQQNSKELDSETKEKTKPSVEIIPVEFVKGILMQGRSQEGGPRRLGLRPKPDVMRLAKRAGLPTTTS